MKQRSLFSILCFVFISFGVASVSAQTCSNDRFFRPNSTYDANRRLILSSLPSNVSAQEGLFYNGSIGQEPNRVYATGMCIPGSNSDDCFDCIKTASDGLLQSCPNQTDAFSWPGEPTLCHVRYSNTSFSGSADLDPPLVLTNTGDINSNITEFTTIWEGLMGRMITAASTAKSSPSSSSNYYKADSTALTPIQNIYALMQCAPDISSSDCGSCLRQSASAYQSCCGQKQGGVVMRPSCFLRWDLYIYSRAFNNLTVDSPPPQPSVTAPPPAGDQANTTDNDSKGISAGVVVAIAVAVFVTVLILLVLGFVLFRRRKSYQTTETESDITTVHSLQFDFKTIEAATDKFSRNNKLGQGGFGEVFKGTLPNGIEVAVKRLSEKSAQGTLEFKNEVVLVAKLQHRNLVRLLGFCLEGVEKILVYEFVYNKSLDYFLFDRTKQGQLDWTKRYNIIEGITRGILYLHQDSRLTIIHRDLKASNILLDADMNPKIADFGMARIFGIDQSGANTNRIVGTRGYMSPEYLMQGLFSTKSDVYSFGVLVLEIICGQNNRCFPKSDTTVENLVTYAWRLWRNGTPLELVDPTMSENILTEEVTRCIHIALLCVQEDPTDRPSLSTIMLMFTNDTLILPVPQPPGFFFPNKSNQEQDGHESSQSTIRSDPQTINDVTITDLEPR
ncbi:Cysteine-rich receptor-like protein kinase 11 [Cardamine amara subsp. amara]|uniref:Cysteine-rich receptor-like protein kinase 11 n=1 Tax=Cardamine amara subsp. amara TaxID=228776 RepID=A0ABD1A439_CARAN